LIQVYSWNQASVLAFKFKPSTTEKQDTLVAFPVLSKKHNHMNDPNPHEKRKTIASVTLLLVENSDGVRFCDTVSAMDESQMSPYDVAKFQFHCFHWFAALHEILIRKLVYQDDIAKEKLQRQADELKQIKERLKG
jgi:hypothetical protein